jgi:hypothetical protein
MGGHDFESKSNRRLWTQGAVVAWSNTARNSLWVRAEATVARESGKLVQLSPMDRSRHCRST